MPTVDSMRFGLRYFEGGSEVHLLQIAGNGRVRLGNQQQNRAWWQRPIARPWEVYEASTGHTLPTEGEAMKVARNLLRADYDV